MQRWSLCRLPRPARCALALLGALALARNAAGQGAEGVTQSMDKVVPYAVHGDVRMLSKRPLLPSAPNVHRRLLPGPPNRKVPPARPLASPSIFPFVTSAPSAQMPSPTQNFAGLNFSDSCTGGQCGAGWPPDTNGDVGRSHYIQAVNDAYAIYSKAGILLASFTEDQLWSGSGSNPCNGNSHGDPVVVYDALADRWILTHFAFGFSGSSPVSPFFECIAVSKTNDLVAGGWWLYALRMDPGGAGKPPVGTMNDYPKFGLWPDCLYMAANEFTEPGDAFAGTAYASLSRSDLESGAALTWSLGFLNNSIDPFTMIPSTVLGSSPGALPPAGTPNYFVSESQTAYAFEVRKFTAGTNCGGGGTLGAPTNVSQASYPVPSGATVPQPNTANTLDVIDDRLMQKVQYRKVGSAESLWVVHNVTTPSSTVGEQWAQINVTGGAVATTPIQQQIYAPDTTLYRWMGSIAADSAGNVALGYSTANGTSPNFPSIAYAGRLAIDPLGQLPQSERQLVAGAGSQTNNCGGAPCDRWGDYSAMSVDPSDDCTFWYTTEYYSSQANGTGGNWQTRIGAFKFPSCGGSASTATATLTPTLTPTGTPSLTPTVTPMNSPTRTPTYTPTAPSTRTPTSTVTGTPTRTGTNTPTPTPTATDTPAIRCAPTKLGGPLGWVSAAAHPLGVKGAAAAMAGSRVYVSHGSSGGEVATATAYDIVSNTWTPLSAATVPRSQLVGVCGEEASGAARIFAVGGRRHDPILGDLVVDTVEAYDPVADSWTARASMPTARAGIGAVWYPRTGAIYVFGGRTDPNPRSGTPLNVTEVYDIATDTWSTKAPMPVAMSDVSVVRKGRRVFVIGGYDGTSVSGLVEIYTPLTDTWSSGVAMPSPRANLLAGRCNGKIWAIGGFDGTADVGTNQAYDPVTNSWYILPQPPMPSARSLLAGAVVSNNKDIFATGGDVGGTVSAANEHFTCIGGPLVPTPTSTPTVTPTATRTRRPTRTPTSPR